MTTIGILSPGEMGSAIGAALARQGARVVTTVAGRSERTRGLAERAGLELLPDADAVCTAADAVLSVVPPGDAAAAAASIRGKSKLWADLNAVSPARVRTFGCDVDGSISGGPPAEGRLTRIYLSGPRAQELADLLAFGPEVELILVGDEVGSASAVKMSTASVYKGNCALIAQALLSADANGVLDHVLSDLGDLASDPGWLLAITAAKSARFVGEMEEIAATQTAVGLTPALFEAMAEVYRAMAELPAAGVNPEDVRPGMPLAEALVSFRRAEAG